MDIPELPELNDTFDTLDQVEERLVAAVFPITGFGLKRNHKDQASTAYFYCQSGRLQRDKDKVTRCEFRLKAFWVNEEWRIEEVKNEHNHGKSKQLVRDPNYLPSSTGLLARVMKEMRAKGHVKSSQSTPRSNSKASSYSSRKRRIPSTPDSSDSEDEDNTKRQRQSSRQQTAGDGSPRPKIDSLKQNREILIVSDSEDEDIKPSISVQSLEDFLDCLSPTFKLSRHANLFRNPKIGVATSGQLVEVCQSNLSGLMGIVGEKMGFAPADAFKKGMEKHLKKKK